MSGGYSSYFVKKLESVTSEDTQQALAEGIRALGFGVTTIVPLFGADSVSVSDNFVPVNIWKQRILLRTKVAKPYGESPDDIFFDTNKDNDWERDDLADDDEVPF